MAPAQIAPDRKDNDKLTKEETTSYRSILGALLWLTATRLDLVADVSHLATHLTSAEIRHLRQANQVLKQAQAADRKSVGLYFRKLHPERGLRIACFHDSSSHTKEKAYAHEGVLVLLMEDHLQPQEGQYDVTCDDWMGWQSNMVVMLMYFGVMERKRSASRTLRATQRPWRPSQAMKQRRLSASESVRCCTG